MASRTLRALCFPLFACACAGAKGIVVKFLPNPAEDSIVRYDVYRAPVSGETGDPVGSIYPAPAADTLRYPDLDIERGLPYYYKVKAVNAAGLESDWSDETEAGLPSLSLPDTLRPDARGVTRFSLTPAADPLKGATLSIALLDSSRFSLRYDTTLGSLQFSALARPDSARVVVRAAYYGKFEDHDTAWVVAGPAAPTASLTLPRPGAKRALFDGARLEVPVPGGKRDFQGRFID